MTVTEPRTAEQHSRRQRKSRAWLGLLAAGCFAPLASAAVELSTVLEATRVSPPAQVEFQEERHNPLFEEPLRLDGYLEYLGPGALSKVIEAPFQEAFLIQDGEILMRRDGETRKVPVKRSKALQTILGAIEAILAGEVERLEAVFDYEITGTDDVWSVELTPKSRRISRHLGRLRITGDDQAISQILIDLRDGEFHVMNILREAPAP
jgi:hypothetical protein